jgi:ABC-type transport system substrate-binding protein
VAATAKISGRFGLRLLAGMAVLDAYMLRITLTKPDFNFIYILAMVKHRRHGA